MSTASHALIGRELGLTAAMLRAMAEDEALHRALEKASGIARSTLASGGTILLCGNGGSAADAQHLAGELVGRYRRERPGLAALALGADGAVLTALGNDFGYDQVFARQVQALGRPGDVLVALTTSGKSPNVLRAIEAARGRALSIIGFTGRGRDDFAALCDVCLAAPAEDTARIQEGHIALGHLLCVLIEEGA
jgi:D-sedoheptulose 7-phosphate isomerase